MRHVPLAILALAAGAVACQEVATSPESVADLTPRAWTGNPPPPPIDTGASFRTTVVQSTRSPSSNAPSWLHLASLFQDECTATPEQLVNAIPVVPVTYMYDPAANTGWLHFSDAPFDAADVDANGMIRMRQEETGQDFTGKGKIRLSIFGCDVAIDLTDVDDAASNFGECQPNIVDFARQDETPPERDGGCFLVVFDSVEINGVPTPVDIQMDPAPPPCEPNDTRPGCNIDIDIVESAFPRPVVQFRQQSSS